MTTSEAREAISRCSKREMEAMLGCTPREMLLMLEAKLYADATISTPPKEVYGVLASGRKEVNNGKDRGHGDAR